MAKANDSLAVYVSQCDDVQRMRDQMLTFNKTDPNAIRKAIQNVTILRVQHQLKRIREKINPGGEAMPLNHDKSLDEIMSI